MRRAIGGNEEGDERHLGDDGIEVDEGGRQHDRRGGALVRVAVERDLPKASEGVGRSQTASEGVRRHPKESEGIRRHPKASRTGRWESPSSAHLEIESQHSRWRCEEDVRGQAWARENARHGTLSSGAVGGEVALGGLWEGRWGRGLWEGGGAVCSQTGRHASQLAVAVGTGWRAKRQIGLQRLAVGRRRRGEEDALHVGSERAVASFAVELCVERGGRPEGRGDGHGDGGERGAGREAET